MGHKSNANNFDRKITWYNDWGSVFISLKLFPKNTGGNMNKNQNLLRIYFKNIRFIQKRNTHASWAKEATFDTGIEYITWKTYQFTT